MLRGMRTLVAAGALLVLAACSKENNVVAKGDGKTTDATCTSLCDALARGDFGDCDGKGETYQKDGVACVNECNDHVAEGKASQAGLNCAIDLSKQPGKDRCQRLVSGGECGDFF